jgi:hypothetical protein
MSTIPQRPPDTPLLQYYTLGKYPKKVEQQAIKKNYAEPGDAAKITDRNPQPFDDVPAKAITQGRHPLSAYDPTNYTKAQKLGLSVNKDVSTNSLHLAKVSQQKKDLQRGKDERMGVPRAHEVKKEEFMRKKELSSSRRSKLSSSGHSNVFPVTEKNLRQTLNDNTFQNDKKHTFYTNGTGKSAHKTMPDYMRHLE